MKKGLLTKLYYCYIWMIFHILSNKVIFLVYWPDIIPFFWFHIQNIDAYLNLRDDWNFPLFQIASGVLCDEESQKSDPRGGASLQTHQQPALGQLVWPAYSNASQPCHTYYLTQPACTTMWLRETNKLAECPFTQWFDQWCAGLGDEWCGTRCWRRACNRQVGNGNIKQRHARVSQYSLPQYESYWKQSVF